MVGTFLTLIVCLGLVGCVGADGQIITLDNPSATAESFGIQGAQGIPPESDGTDPGSGQSHPSLGELGDADTPGGTTDEEDPFGFDKKIAPPPPPPDPEEEGDSLPVLQGLTVRKRKPLPGDWQEFRTEADEAAEEDPWRWENWKLQEDGNEEAYEGENPAEDEDDPFFN